jgi:hypothetical protein
MATVHKCSFQCVIINAILSNTTDQMFNTAAGALDYGVHAHNAQDYFTVTIQKLQRY